jgi:hypothetical protein
LVEVGGNVGAVLPSQIEVLFPNANTGVCIGLTVTFTEVGTAHCPAPGVNV